MSAKKPAASRSVSSVIGLATRRGEGVEVAVTHYAKFGTDGTSVMSLGMDMSAAPVPDRQYVADVYSVASSRHGISLLFGQEKIGGGLRSLLIVQMPINMISEFVESIDGMTEPNLAEVLSQRGMQPEAPAVIQVEPAQTLSLKANMLTAAFTNGEACMDFYNMSAFVTSALIRHRDHTKGHILPVVRVELASAQLWGLADSLRPLILAPAI